MNIKNVRDAFTLLEVLLASVIFMISVAGIFATLNAVRAPVANKQSQLSAAVFGKQILERLYSNVNANTWGTPCATNPCTDFDLAPGSHQVSVATLATAGLSWPTTALSNANLIGGVPVLQYTVTCSDGTCSNLNLPRQVNLNINWPTVS